MARIYHNVGRFDALARRVAGGFALLAGLVSLSGFFGPFPLLTWIILALMFCTGIYFVIPGMRGGTAIFGVLLALVAVLDGWLAVTHRGVLALLVGVIFALDGFVTPLIGSPLNALLGRDTHDREKEWQTPHAAH
jgi:hypothetical protein